MARTKRLRRTKSARHKKTAKPKISRTKNYQSPKPAASYDVQGILADKILKNQTIPENGTTIENLIYNATPKVADIGYGHGFSVGRELCLKQVDEQKFTTVLDKIGLPNALYYPLKDSLIITSKPTKEKLRSLGHPIHIYEAGVISGYLSISTGFKITTEERRCIFNGSDSCQFIAIPMSSRSEQPRIDLDDIVDSIAFSITENNFRKLRNEYYRIMAYLPLLQQPIYEQVRKLLFMSGERIADYSEEGDVRRIVGNITNYFGVKETEIKLRKKGKSIIKLRYESYNSIYPYVSMPTAMIIGFVSKALSKKAEVSVSTGKNKTYTTIIDFK